MVNVRYAQTSLYFKTPIKEFYLSYWNPRNIQKSRNDIRFVIPSEFHLRPDLASYKFYGTEKFWYVFALRNKDKLIDPIFDFKAGLEIFVPSKEVLNSGF